MRNWWGKLVRRRRRITWGAGIGVLLLAVAISLLSLADSFTPEAANQCARNLRRSEWPGKWLGCALSKHGDLAGALIGAAGLLWAAWLAFQAVQEQMADQRDQDRERQARELTDLKASIYAEIADCAGRCLNDYLSPFRDWKVSETNKPTAERIQNFRPFMPVVLPGVAGKLGVLDAPVLTTVTQFYFRFFALSQAVETVLAVCTRREDANVVRADLARDQQRVDFIKERLRSCFAPARNALRDLESAGSPAVDREIVRVYPNLARKNVVRLHEALQQFDRN